MLAPNETIQHLQAARNLIADPARWGDWTTVNRDDNRFCAIQADLHSRGLARNGDWGLATSHLITAANEMLPEVLAKDPGIRIGNPYEAVYMVNDQLGHEAVMCMFTRAIELASQEISNGPA